MGGKQNGQPADDTPSETVLDSTQANSPSHTLPLQTGKHSETVIDAPGKITHTDVMPKPDGNERQQNREVRIASGAQRRHVDVLPAPTCQRDVPAAPKIWKVPLQ